MHTYEILPWMATDPRIAEMLARREAERVERERVAAERASQYGDLCRTYVREHVPAFARAAANGCDVHAHAEEHAEAELRARLAPCGVLVASTSNDDPRAHACPSQHAYDVLDRVTEVLTSRELPAPIASATPRIARIDTCPANGCRAGIRTVVHVALAWRDGTIGELCVYADTADQHDHEAPSDDEE